MIAECRCICRLSIVRIPVFMPVWLIGLMGSGRYGHISQSARNGRGKGYFLVGIYKQSSVSKRMAISDRFLCISLFPCPTQATPWIAPLNNAMAISDILFSLSLVIQKLNRDLLQWIMAFSDSFFSFSRALLDDDVTTSAFFIFQYLRPFYA